MIDHCVPFQCSVRLSAVLEPPCAPTAQILLGPATLMAWSAVNSPGMPGLDTWLHCVPSQCVISAVGLLMVAELPTAQTSFGPATPTPVSWLAIAPGLGLVTIRQAGSQPGR